MENTVTRKVSNFIRDYYSRLILFQAAALKPPTQGNDNETETDRCESFSEACENFVKSWGRVVRPTLLTREVNIKQQKHSKLFDRFHCLSGRTIIEIESCNFSTARNLFNGL